MSDSSKNDPFAQVAAARAAGPAADTVRPSEKGAAAEFTHVAPASADAPPPPAECKGLGAPASVWTYRDGEGRPLRYTYRFTQPAAGEENAPRECWTGKTIRPVTGWRDRAGKFRWRWASEPANAPLYRLDELARRPGATVGLVEGEKAADAAAAHFPDIVWMTWPGGSNAVAKADFSPLGGRRVLIWPDADDPGRKAAAAAARSAIMAGATSAKAVQLPAFLPAGWDLADPWPTGFTKADATDLMAETLSAPVECGDQARWPFGFRMDGGGLWYDQPVQGGGPPIPQRISGPFEVLGEGRSPEGDGWAVVVRFRDRDNREKRVAISKGRLAAGGAEVRSELADAGLTISPARGKADKFAIALMEVESVRRLTLAPATGWCGSCFVLPGEVIGAGSEEAVLFTGEAGALHYSRAGSLDGWRSGVAALAEGNDLLAFSLSLAFLGPLLRPLEWEGGGVHLRGGSSCGKSTLQQAAGSTWGGGGAKGFVHDWRMTGNALEMLAYGRNDCVLILDELKQIAAEEAGAAAYMLASGQAKARARPDGSLRRRAEWRVAVLSSGELSLADHVSSSRKGERSYAGQELRLIDIAADMGGRNGDGSPMGVWQVLHGRATSFDASKALELAAKANYGHAGPAFVEALTRQRGAAVEQAKALHRAFLQAVAREGDTGQAQRAAERFGAVAVAGELAAMFGVLPWPANMAAGAAARLYHRWASGFGRDRSREASEIIRRIKGILESEAANFAPWTDSEDDFPSEKGRDEQARGLKSWGYRHSDGVSVEFRINDAGWDYLSTGFGRKEAAKALHEAGLLERGEGEHWKRKHSRKGQKLRFWTVKGAILEADLGD